MNRQQVGIYLVFSPNLHDNIIDRARLAQDHRASGRCASRLGKFASGASMRAFKIAPACRDTAGVAFS